MLKSSQWPALRPWINLESHVLSSRETAARLSTYPTDDVRSMTKAAVEAVDRVFRPGFKYSKAEVLLVSLCQRGEYTEDLFSISQPVATERVMGVLDAINGRWGRGTMRLASVPTNPEWGMRRDMMSQRFTTRVDQLWTVYCK